MCEVHADAAELTQPHADLVRRRLAREREARAAAEAIIEQKSRELYEANRQLEELLSGSVKVLTDVLAMARPEIFEKAGKVQRWARRIAPHLEILRPWELDLAAMMYPLGVLSLPDDIASKYALDETLSDEEKSIVAESSQAAHDLLCNIPRMEPVARAVLYCRKGFDGSGFPPGELKGKDIPKPARVLKILSDLADDSTGVNRKRDFQEMARRRHLYDLDIFKVAFQHLHRPQGRPDTEGEVLALPLALLRTRDIVNRDIVDQNNRLLLAAGAELSEITIRRLRAISAAGRRIEEVEVVRKKPVTA